MKKSKFTEQQIAFTLRQAETGTRVAEVCRKKGISEMPFYRWKRKYGGSEYWSSVGFALAPDSTNRNTKKKLDERKEKTSRKLGRFLSCFSRRGGEKTPLAT